MRGAGGGAAPNPPATGRRAGLASRPVVVAAAARLAGLGPLGVALPLLALTRAAFWAILPHASEDAYIAFRYARHWVQGDGLVFNPGERVMGFTSPLWTCWTALGLAVAADPVLWTRGSALLLDAVTLVCATRLLERHAPRAAAWSFAIFFAAWPFFGALAASGLEMNAMLALTALASYQGERRSRWTGGTLGLLALTRPEGVMAAAVLALWARRSDRWIALAILAAGTAALWLYFGSPVPQSLLAKARLYETPGPWEGRFWWDWLLPAELGRGPTLPEPLQFWSLRVLLAPAVGLGIWSLRRTPALAFGGACCAVWVGYAALGVAYFFWYFSVPAAGVAYLAAAGMPRAVRSGWVYGSLALLVAGTWTTAPNWPYRVRASNEDRLFRVIGEELAREARTGETALVEPLGFIGWLNPGLRLIDEVGLVTPRVTRRRMQGPGWYADLLADERPTWVLVRHGFLLDSLPFTGVGAPFRDSLEQVRSLEPYEPIVQTAEFVQPNDLVLFRRRP